MNFEQAKELSFSVPWKTVKCSDENCWCRIIVPVDPIVWYHPDFPEIKNEIDIADAGALDQEAAKYIVKLHNDKLKQDKNISDSMTKILQEKPVQDYGISQ